MTLFANGLGTGPAPKNINNPETCSACRRTVEMVVKVISGKTVKVCPACDKVQK